MAKERIPSNSDFIGSNLLHHDACLYPANDETACCWNDYELGSGQFQRCEVGNLLKKAGVQIQVDGKVSFVSEEDVISQYVEDYQLA